MESRRVKIKFKPQVSCHPRNKGNFLSKTQTSVPTCKQYLNDLANVKDGYAGFTNLITGD